MSNVFVLGVGGKDRTVTLAGRWLYVLAATADIELVVTTVDGKVDRNTWKPRAHAHLDADIARVELINNSGATNTVELFASYHQFFQPLDINGSAVTVEPGNDPLDVTVGGSVAVTGPVTDVQMRAAPLPAATDTGASRYRIVSTAGTNENPIKAAPGRVFGITGTNTSGTDVYLKLYNQTTAPVVGTDVPVETYALLAGTSFAFPFGDTGVAFSTGIAIAITLNAADADATAIGAGDVVGQLHYK